MVLMSVLSIPRLSLTRVLASGVILNLESKTFQAVKLSAATAITHVSSDGG